VVRTNSSILHPLSPMLQSGEKLIWIDLNSSEHLALKLFIFWIKLKSEEDNLSKFMSSKILTWEGSEYRIERDDNDLVVGAFKRDKDFWTPVSGKLIATLEFEGIPVDDLESK